LTSLEAVAALAGERREGRLQAFLLHHVRLVRLERGLIEFALEADADSDMVGTLRTFLRDETGENWQVSVVRAEGQPTLVQREAAEADAAKADAAKHPLVQAVLKTFPGASVTGVERHDLPSEADVAAEMTEDPEGPEETH